MVKQMKKLLGIIVLGLLSCNLVLAEKDISNFSLNENINNYGWKIKSTKFVSGENPKEIYTLTKDKRFLKCIITYKTNRINTECVIP
jgi:hypothetical protein